MLWMQFSSVANEKVHKLLQSSWYIMIVQALNTGLYKVVRAHTIILIPQYHKIIVPRYMISAISIAHKMIVRSLQFHDDRTSSWHHRDELACTSMIIWWSCELVNFFLFKIPSIKLACFSIYFQLCIFFFNLGELMDEWALIPLVFLIWYGFP